MLLSQSPLPGLPMLNKLCSQKLSNSSSATMMQVKNFSDNSGNIRVAYQGFPGAYGEAAALKAYPNCRTVQCDKFEGAIKAAEIGLADEAVIPIENSIGGTIHANYDLLHRHSLYIVGETHLLINHCLLSLPGVSKEELKSVFSHPQALTQCEMSLAKLGVATVPADNTATAAKFVASQGVRENGAIASARAAQLYGLNILAEKFQTSIVFTLEEGPQKLCKALSVFALRDIHVSKIESRPQEKHPVGAAIGLGNGSNMCFKYVFFLDFEASATEHRAKYAIANLRELASCVRILGCYPMDTAAYTEEHSPSPY